ncbi:MAG: Uncharacterized protein G01um101448_544 [Parcubacteria group bacterium Gr01-1014_48]|nr:MAG: Uncharacterized protein Greene041614_644 [Parcubacteria group bacterium Greene0416_14]TSC73810.1 MAG: Uncharacterized protein G01um101448_544 [Parcubacteria group bacterium Gr01-1014_48]TSD01072.1 MAG: Uncharacterized protein Greene101415_475 [Parcubacteria group bacterium Greene1014_15]TSD08065.1 MAG: Uncharacterized protein Greene07144_458 [Parcubacteria group bacterium Greene0714_4]
MHLRGVDFGHVLGASGVQGFFGEGYWFHKLWKPFGLDFARMTFVSKTATCLSRAGNMSLTRHFTPRNPFPRCVRTQILRGQMLNSVGLSNPGLGALLNTGKWQKHTKPFFISIMSLADTPARRLEELRIMVETIGFCKRDFLASFGLQINLSCPNTGHDTHELIDESAKILDVASILGVPLMPKYSIATAPIQAIMQLNDHPSCDAICVSNTLPFGWQGLDWKRVWGSTTSPLVHLGGGGLSGKHLQPLVCAWIKTLRNAGFTKPINGGGGILSYQNVNQYYSAGASSVFLGSIAVLRPWEVAHTIEYANRINWE